MSKAIDKINQIASKDYSNWLEEAKERQENRRWSDKSNKIAIRILREIRLQKKTKGMTQKKLAEALKVSPQYINKVVKGNENLTLETISKIEQVLGITLLEIPGFETSISFEMDKSSSIFPLHSFNSVSIAKKRCLYDTSSYKETLANEPATGTYG